MCKMPVNLCLELFSGGGKCSIWVFRKHFYTEESLQAVIGLFLLRQFFQNYVFSITSNCNRNRTLITAYYRIVILERQSLH